MQITIVQISNGWVVTVSFPGKGGSSLYCTDFEDVVKQLNDMKNASKKEREEEMAKKHTGIHVPSSSK